MSWSKDSTSVFLGSLTVWEAAKGALLCEEFQMMPDPLLKVWNHSHKILCHFCPEAKKDRMKEGSKFHFIKVLVRESHCLL